MADLAKIVQNEIDQAPAFSGGGFGKHGSTCIALPEGEHDWKRQVHIPDNKNISIKGCGKWSTIINNESGSDYLIDAQAINNVGHIFELAQASIVGGSVSVGRRRGHTVFEDLKFIESPKSAMDFYGDGRGLGATNVTIKEVDTAFCKRGIKFEARTHALIEIKDSRFIGSAEEAIYMDVIGSDITNCDFTGAGGEGFIRYGGEVERSSHHNVYRCRFGSEDLRGIDGEVIDTPDYDIVSGPSSKPGAVMRFRDNEHMGRENTGKSGALGAFKFEHRARAVHITGSFFSNKYQNNIVKEVVTRGAGDNIWSHNIVQRGAPALFSSSGIGWSIT